MTTHAQPASARRCSRSCARWALGILSAVAILATNTAPATAQEAADRIRSTRGTEIGEVTEMTPTEVKFNKKPAGNGAVAVNEIRSIVFTAEPAELTQARVRADNGAYAEAAELLAKIDSSTLKREFVRQDVEFYQAYCAAQLALGGRGTINDAGRQLNSFVRTNPQNYHYFQAVEAMGDLLAADGKLELAQKQYSDLAKAPWPEYKMRAAIAIGRALQGQAKHAEAIAQFETALQMSGDGPADKIEKLAATLGRAVSLAETDQLEAAVAMIEQVIQAADPEQKELHARAYNALGNCYARAGQSKDAILAYLHVDVLYSSVPEAHAEALSQLVPLWQSIGQETQAREARQLLQQRYAGSRWAK